MTNENEKLLRNRYGGALLGLGAGDALGTTLEFKPPGTFSPITTMIGGGPFNLQPGQWTDDTSMALCLTESLLAAVYGQLAGAFHGAEVIPAGWLEKLTLRDLMQQLADDLLVLSTEPKPL